MIAGFEDACHFPVSEDVRRKTVSGRIVGYSGDIAVITNFAHILTKL
jgi:hypothetical protein